MVLFNRGSVRMKLNTAFNPLEMNKSREEKNNIALFQGKVSGVSSKEQKVENDPKKTEGKSIYVGKMNQENDPIAERKALAQKQAMKAVMNAYEGDRKADDSIEECKTNGDAFKAQAKEVELELKQVKEARAQVKEVSTPEEYAAASAEYDDIEKILNNRADNFKSQAMGENLSIEGIKLALVKEHPMVDAQGVSDMILEAASKEAVNMMIDKAKENVDETQKENEDKTKKLQEEKRAEEEKVQSETKDNPTTSENKATPDNAQEIQSADIMQEAVQKQIKNILDSQKVLEEDLKGISVDEIL